jgi:hypothetical protein
MREISWISEDLLASQAGIRSMEIVILHYRHGRTKITTEMHNSGNFSVQIFQTGRPQNVMKSMQNSIKLSQ